MNNEIVKELLEKLKQCDDFHNRCDFLMEHSEITYMLDYITNLQQENKKLKEVIDKLKTNIKNDIDGFRTINEFGESNEILELLDIYLDILKEVK